MVSAFGQSAAAVLNFYPSIITAYIDQHHGFWSEKVTFAFPATCCEVNALVFKLVTLFEGWTFTEKYLRTWLSQLLLELSSLFVAVPSWHSYSSLNSFTLYLQKCKFFGFTPDQQVINLIDLCVFRVSELFVDNPGNTDEKIPVQINITLPRLGCQCKLQSNYQKPNKIF